MQAFRRSFSITSLKSNFLGRIKPYRILSSISTPNDSSTPIPSKEEPSVEPLASDPTAAKAQLAERDSKLATLTTQLTEKESKLATLNHAYLSALADMENLRNRTRKEVESASSFAVGKFAKELVEVADILEMALVSSTPSSENACLSSPDSTNSTSAHLLDDLRQGLSMTHSELLKVFARHGLTPMDPLHASFDPNQHQAIFEVPTNEQEPGTIVSVQKKGYLLNGRVIRAAAVGVAKKP